MRHLFAGLLLAAFLVPGPATAGSWGTGSGGSCPLPTAGFVPQFAAPAPHWQPFPDDTDQVALVQGGVQLGVWRYDAETYYARRGNQWAAAPCPIAPPKHPKLIDQGPVRETKPVGAPFAQPPPCGKPACDCGCITGDNCRCATQAKPTEVGQLPDWMTHGVDRSGLANREKTTICGVEVAKAVGIEALGSDASLPDDAGRPFLVAVGSPEQLARIKVDVTANPALANFRQQFYAPDDPMIHDRDGHLLYTAGLWFIRADGLALSYAAEYPGPVGLALAAVEALRRIDPNWHPDKVPDLTKPPLIVPRDPNHDNEQPKPPPATTPIDWTPWIVGAVAIGAVWLLVQATRKK